MKKSVLSKANIMIVDDDEVCRLYFSDLFKTEGYNVSVFEDGFKAVQSYNTNKPDAVLMDIRMPNLCGTETLRMLKKLDKRIPIVMMTAYSSLDVALDCGRLGADSIIRKPGEIDKVIEVIEKAITKNKMTVMQKSLSDKSKSFEVTQQQQQTEPGTERSYQQEINYEVPLGIMIPYYTKYTERNMKFVRIRINNIITEIMLAPGASVVSLNTETVKAIQVNEFGKPYAMNTTAGSAIAYPFLAETISLGNIELYNIECAHVPSLRNNLLGATFFKHFEYTIKEQQQTIGFFPIDEKRNIYTSKDK